MPECTKALHAYWTWNKLNHGLFFRQDSQKVARGSFPRPKRKKLTHARRKCIIRMLPPLLTRGVGGKQKVPSFDNHRIHCNGEAMTPPEQCDRPRQRGHGGAKA